MFALLILSFFLQLNCLFLVREDFQKWREAFLKSVIALFTTVLISTELLSYFYLLKTEIVIGWWVLLNLGLSTYLYCSPQTSQISFFNKFSESLKSKSLWFSTVAFNTIWIFISIIYLTVLFTAIVAPPNTADSLTYHLPRVAHWIQAGSVEFYQTNNDRQLFNPPLFEYFILHLQLLAGSDRFANLVQFFSYFTCGIATSLITQRFKLDYFGQLLTFLISASIPMAIVQGSSSKNDLVASLFIVAFFFYFLKALEENGKENFIFAGLTLGLALLSKGNAYFFCFPIGVFIFFKSIIQNRFTSAEYKFILQTFGVLLIAVVINSGHYYRNWQLYNTPVKGEERLRNDQVTLPIAFANVVRNYSVHIGTQFEVSNKLIGDAISSLLGDELNNPASTLDNQKFVLFQSFIEDSTANPLHIFFLTIAILYAFLLRNDKEKGNLIILSLSIIVGFLLFCTFLKWNYWVSRIHTPLFFLGSSLITYFLVKKLSNIMSVTIILFFINAVLALYVATPRTLIPYDIDCVYLVPRSELYFSSNKNLEPVFWGAAEYLKNHNPEEIGLHLSMDNIYYNFGDWEYPYFILLKDNFADKPVLRHVGVNNPSNRLKPDKPMPEWVISTKKENIIENTEYEEVWKKDPVRILRKKNLADN